ncbi:MAG: arginine repressor [Acidobacteriota bacterium]
MSRLQRQQAVLRAVTQHEVRSQRDLIERLEADGLRATQATISRDVRQLGLVKLPVPGGGFRYGLPGDIADAADDGALRQACQQFVVDAGPANAMLVLRTQSGHANAAAIAIDNAELPEVVGTLAGDDTVLVFAESARDRDRLLDKFRGLLE